MLKLNFAREYEVSSDKEKSLSGAVTLGEPPSCFLVFQFKNQQNKEVFFRQEGFRNSKSYLSLIDTLVLASFRMRIFFSFVFNLKCLNLECYSSGEFSGRFSYV